MMHDPVHGSFSFKGEWRKWSRYDLADGIVIPAEDAELLPPYDPWKEFRANLGKYRTVKGQPYLPFLELGRNMRKVMRYDTALAELENPSRFLMDDLQEAPVPVPSEIEELILAWCNNHGLLGLVPVLTNSIRLDPRLTPQSGDTLHRVMFQRCYHRLGGRWIEYTARDTANGRTPDEVKGSVYQIYKESLRPTVSWFDDCIWSYKELPLERIKAFFRPASEWKSFQPPRPGSLEFWQVYREPIWLIASWALWFEKRVDNTSLWAGGAPNALAVASPLNDYSALEQLAASTAPSFQFYAERNRLDEERLSPGLLASFALMFLWDRAEGRRVLHCQNCNAYFVSDEPRAAYCGPKCRNTAQVRRQRMKKQSGKGE